MANEYAPGYPVNPGPAPDGDTVKAAVEKHIAEFLKAYADLSSMYQQVITELEYADVDMVDSKHADGSANNIPLLNGQGHLTNDLEGAAWNIPTSDVGGNIFLRKREV